MGGNGVDQCVVERTEDGDREKRKKRRQNRRLKQNPSTSVNGVRAETTQGLINVCSSNHFPSFGCYPPSEQHVSGTHASNVHGLINASKVTSNSLPMMHFTEELAPIAMENQLTLSDLGQKIYPKSCPVTSSYEESVGSFAHEDLIAPHWNSSDAQRKHFFQHWSTEAVLEALEKGNAFKASFHVNAHNRLEAYCRIDGVKTDILINGIPAQNRAVEGDTVAIKVDPLPLWTRMRGSSGPINNPEDMENFNLLPEDTNMVGDSCKGKSKVEEAYEYGHSGNCSTFSEKGPCYENSTSSGETNGHEVSASGTSHANCADEQNNKALVKICATMNSFPSRRPTGRVVAIIERSPRRFAVVGFLSAKNWIQYRESFKKDIRNKSSLSFSNLRYIQLIPTDPKFQKMRVPVDGLPDAIKKRLENGDTTVEIELVAAEIDDWSEESLVPQARVLHSLGRGGEVESNIAAILFENAVCCSEFSEESLSCLPSVPWEVPSKEYESRRDLRELCIFTIDPSTATDLDDALSVEKLSGGICRVGVHIADASYFVQPHTALDIEAQTRSTSVYLLQRKLPMLPTLLSENLCSLTPGVDRLAFSIFFDINLAGGVVDRWVGRTVVRSCCKLSYEHAQNIIDGTFDIEKLNALRDGLPQLHGHFDWLDVTRSVKLLSGISRTLRENRFNVGAVRLESSKVVFLYDEDGLPCDSKFCDREDSNFLVEEFMLLANTTAAEIISQAFPDSALLRRHPEPDLRKLREFEAFCSKHNLHLDTTFGQLHHSLERIREELKNDSMLFDILVSYALKPMQLAKYFCSGVLKGAENDWGHYALAVPVYTHFTSPLRRYPDILVHRTLAATIEAEDLYFKKRKTFRRVTKGEELSQCFTGVRFNKDAADSIEGQEALSAAALKFGVPCTELLADIAAYCNERTLSSRHVQDACDRLYMWALLKKKEKLLSEARVLGLGPRFMSIYIQKLAIERRIYYDDVEGLMVEWLDATSALVLSFSKNKRFLKRGSPPGKCRALDDVAWVVNPCSLTPYEDSSEGTDFEGCTAQVDLGAASGPNDVETLTNYGRSEAIDPVVFPITVRLLSTIPVALYAVGGDDGPIDIRARLYVGSYFVSDDPCHWKVG